MAVCEWVQMHEPDFYCDGTFKLVHNGTSTTIFSRIMLNNKSCFSVE
jgi:hypothetical protein